MPTPLINLPGAIVPPDITKAEALAHRAKDKMALARTATSDAGAVRQLQEAVSELAESNALLIKALLGK